MGAPLTFLFNKILSENIFPRAFKVAKVKPLYKAGDRNDVSNYRPVSLISSLSKVFEKILKRRITSYLDKYTILSDRQYGFRNARSAQDAIAYLTKQINEAIDTKKPALCIFVDLAKAFDTVSHTELLRVLENIGFRGGSLNLLKSYLTNRVQCVEVQSKTSSFKEIEYGVPQGTVLGPLLFNIYLNDLFYVGVGGEVVSFADDTAIFYKHTSWNGLKTLVEEDFLHIATFFNNRKLTINWKKTFFVPFTSYSKNLPLFSSINIKCESFDYTISMTKHIKYLGVMVDCHLNWNKHLNALSNKLRCLISKFKYFKQIFDLAQLRVLYCSLVQSHLVYGIVAWGGATNVHLKQLEITQKWILKIIFNKTYMFPSDQLYEESGMFDIRQLFFKHLAIRQYKEKDNLVFAEHEHFTRQGHNQVVVPRACKTVGQRCHSYLAPRVYNAIPEEIKQVNTCYLFKKKLGKWIKDNSRHMVNRIIDFKNN